MAEQIIKDRFKVQKLLGKTKDGSLLLTEEYGNFYLLKQYRKELAENSLIRTRLFLETKTLTNLKHPNILFPNECFLEGPYFYTVSEPILGSPLRDLLKTREFEPTEAWKLFETLAEGLAYLHSHKKNHGEINPDHIFLDPNGVVKLFQPGICSLIAKYRDSLTGPLEDLFSSENHSCSEAADIYDLTKIAFLLLLEPEKRASQKTWDLTQLPAATPEEVLRFFSKGLSASGHNRFQNSDEFLPHLKRTLKHFPPEPEPEPEPDPTSMNEFERTCKLDLRMVGLPKATPPKKNNPDPDGDRTVLKPRNKKPTSGGDPDRTVLKSKPVKPLQDPDQDRTVLKTRSPIKMDQDKTVINSRSLKKPDGPLPIQLTSDETSNKPDQPNPDRVEKTTLIKTRKTTQGKVPKEPQQNRTMKVKSSIQRFPLNKLTENELPSAEKDDDMVTQLKRPALKLKMDTPPPPPIYNPKTPVHASSPASDIPKSAPTMVSLKENQRLNPWILAGSFLLSLPIAFFIFQMIDNSTGISPTKVAGTCSQFHVQSNILTAEVEQEVVFQIKSTAAENLKITNSRWTFAPPYVDHLEEQAEKIRVTFNETGEYLVTVEIYNEGGLVCKTSPIVFLVD